MADIFTKAKRSFVMSRIRSRGNKDTELALAKFFRRHKITGWRRQVKISTRSSQRELAHSSRAQGRRGAKKSFRAGSRRLLQTKPDFIFPKSRTAIFVDGCFWHGCPQHGTKPKGNAAFWKKKFASNLTRDRLVNRALQRAGWHVVRIWEHELARKHEARLLRQIQRALQ